MISPINCKVFIVSDTSAISDLNYMEQEISEHQVWIYISDSNPPLTYWFCKDAGEICMGNCSNKTPFEDVIDDIVSHWSYDQ